MSSFATKNENDGQVSVYFNIEEDEVMAIGEKMEAINEQAYMNGYNWEAFLKHYLQAHQPELLEGLDTDSEAGTYVALYDQADAHKADKLIAIIDDLIESPDKALSFLEQNSEDIEWD